MNRAEQNRRDFPFVVEWLKVLADSGITATVKYASNGKREVGERFEDRCKREGLTECRYLHYGVSA